MPMANTEDLWVPHRKEEKSFEDEYLLGDIIGRGTFSTTYKCLRKGRTEWTCKVLEKRQLCSEATVRLVLPRLLKLKHPNIISMKEVFESEMVFHLVMEYARGGEIFEKIVEKGQYSEQDAAQAVRDILQGLKYLHSEGIVHGNIKPENLLYETEMGDSKLKIADFGLIQLFPDRIFSVDNLAGCNRCCAPEVLLGMESDYPADLWGLGVVLYTMLCGTEPFWEESRGTSIYQNIIQGNCSFSSPVWDEISQDVKDLITLLLCPEPKKRPTAEEALNHPWTMGISTCSVPRDNMIKGLKEYNARRRFRVATKAVLATRRAFHLLQLNQDGADKRCRPFEEKLPKNFAGTKQCKSYRTWCPIEGSSRDKRANEQKSLSLTTR